MEEILKIKVLETRKEMLTEEQMEFLEGMEFVDAESLPGSERVVLAVVQERVSRYGVRAMITRREWSVLNTLMG